MKKSILFEIRVRRKLKGLFYLLRLDRLIPTRLFQFLANAAAISKWIAANKDCPYNDFYTSSLDNMKRKELYEYIIKTQELDTDIDYLEFGVLKGESFKWWLGRLQNENARFYGFDTFSGLPEAWGPFKKGTMGNGNAPPEIEGDRHTFYQGLFQQTLIPFLKEYKSNKRKIIHLDADLYSATLYVLTLMTPYLNSGDIIFFDEFNVPMHEFKAFDDWSRAFYIEYEVLGAINNFYQIAIKIK